MKKLLALLLAGVMLAGTGALTAFAKDREEHDDIYDNLDFFKIDEINATILPGQDYYFKTDWEGSPIDDDFFQYFKVSISVKSGDDDVKSTTVRQRVDKAEFVRSEETGDYLFHFRANTSFSYDDDLPVLIRVLAKDKENTDKRAWYEMDLDVGYSDSYLSKEDSTMIDRSQYNVSNSTPAIEFDKGLKSCRLDFDDGSYFTLRLSTSKRFNFGYTDLPNQFIVQANPGASLYFHSFYTRPKMANEDVFKLKVPLDKKYLYEIKPDNSLTLLSDVNNNGYFGFTTSSLGAYVASDRPLKSATTTVGVTVDTVQTGTAATPGAPTISGAPTINGSTASAGSVNALNSLLTKHFTNKFVLLSNGTEYAVLPKVTSFSVKIDLAGMDTANLRLYTYDGPNNRLIGSTTNPKVGADGSLVFTTNTKGYYVVSSGALSK